MTTDIDNGNDKHKDIIQWGRDYLSSHGYTLKNNSPKNVQITPWSYVVRFATSDGHIYLKHTPNLLALEAKIIQILHDQFHAPVPKIIANNAELNCFLMKDAGRTLREILKKHFDVALVYKAIDKFTSMQLVVADHINLFLDMGAPDWRLNKLPDLYLQLLLQKDLLLEDGLSEKEITELQMLSPTVTNLCDKLSEYSIKQSIVQPDFNDNNILITDKSQNVTIIDLGEIVISHPFFSLINFLRQMKKHHDLKDQDKSYVMIMDAYLNNFSAFESRKNIFNAFELVRPLWFIYAALAGERLINACGKEKIMSIQQGKLSASLKEFMAACFVIGKG